MHDLDPLCSWPKMAQKKKKKKTGPGVWTRGWVAQLGQREDFRRITMHGPGQPDGAETKLACLRDQEGPSCMFIWTWAWLAATNKERFRPMNLVATHQGHIHSHSLKEPKARLVLKTRRSWSPGPFFCGGGGGVYLPNMLRFKPWVYIW